MTIYSSLFVYCQSQTAVNNALIPIGPKTERLSRLHIVVDVANKMAVAFFFSWSNAIRNAIGLLSPLYIATLHLFEVWADVVSTPSRVSN